jgi:hypothetical protein
MKPNTEGKQNKTLLEQNMIYRHDVQKLMKINNALTRANKELALQFKNRQKSKKSTESLSVDSYSNVKVPIYIWCERFLNDFKK